MPAALYDGWYSSGSSAIRRAVLGGAGGLTAAALALAVIVGEIYTVGSATHQLVSYAEGKIRLRGCYVIRRMGLTPEHR